MLVKLSDLRIFFPLRSTEKAERKQKWRTYATAPSVHLAIGMVCAAMALPFGLQAAALAPIAIGFAKGVFDHRARNDADPANLAWVIAGAALVVGFAKLAGLS